MVYFLKMEGIEIKRNIIICILGIMTIATAAMSINLVGNIKELRVESDKNLYIAQEYSKELEKRDNKIKELESIQAKYDSKNKEIEIVRNVLMNEIEDIMKSIEPRITNENLSIVKEFREKAYVYKTMDKTNISDLIDIRRTIVYYSNRI